MPQVYVGVWEGVGKFGKRIGEGRILNENRHIHYSQKQEIPVQCPRI